MTVVDWHPEQLIDKHHDGSLSATERRELDEHLEACAVCRFELLVGDDLDEEADEQGGDVSHLVLAAVKEDRRRQPMPRKRRTAVAIFAVAALVATSAAALYRAKPMPRRLAPPVLQERIDEVVVPEAPEQPAAEAEAEQEPEPEAVASAEAPSAEALFAQANEARRKGQDQRALALYRQLQRRYPDSKEAQLSHATVGRMLQSGDPEAALRSYDRYLEDESGSVSEEALVGRAAALEKLGRKAEERAAWQELLRRYPSSIHAARARARLAALSAAD